MWIQWAAHYSWTWSDTNVPEFPPPAQVTISSENNSQRPGPASYPRDKADEKNRVIQEQVFDMPQDGVIHSPSYSPILPHFSTRTVLEVTFGTQRQWYEFVDRQGTKTDLSYIIYHENNKCYFWTEISELKSAPPYTFPFDIKV